MLTVKNVATSLERALFSSKLGKLSQLTWRRFFVIDLWCSFVRYHEKASFLTARQYDKMEQTGTAEKNIHFEKYPYYVWQKNWRFPYFSLYLYRHSDSSIVNEPLWLFFGEDRKKQLLVKVNRFCKSLVLTT